MQLNDTIFDDMTMAKEIAARVKEKGGMAYFVGGYVRDEIMGIDNKDLDIEFHGIEERTLLQILESFGEIYDVGASFGVYQLRGYGLDLALPRMEKAIGKGHKDFQVIVDPYLGTKDAASRRDFTVNALMKEVLTGKIVDHFHGLEHLRNKLLVHVNRDGFVEDPLRLFRGAQFAARFEFEIAEETRELCRGMDVTNLPKERVFGEMKKALLQAKHPSIFFKELEMMDQLSFWFPEIQQIIRKNENHFVEILDGAAKCREQVKQPLPFMLSALCISLEDREMVNHLLFRFTSEKQICNYVINMVEYHRKPYFLASQNAGMEETNTLFYELVEPADLIQLVKCSMSEIRYDDFLKERLRAYEEMMQKPYVMGRDLIQAGLQPDKHFSQILDHAHKLRMAGVEKEEALKQTLAYARLNKWKETK